MVRVSDRKTYTPSEFAALFSREKTWAYRMLYSGKIVGISDYGRMMIPASEAERIAGEGTRYLGKKKAAKKAAKKKEPTKPAKPPSNGSVQWAAWVEKKKSGGAKSKGLGIRAKRIDSRGSPSGE